MQLDKTVKQNIIKYKKSSKENKLIGVNIGKNKSSINSINDYLLCMDELGSVANYITINILKNEGVNVLKLSVFKLNLSTFYS